MAVLLGCYLYDDHYQRALPAALAIEVFHNFTLVHDDIMDEAELRRGKESVHKKFGSNTAIMIGDVMLIQSYRILLELDEEVNLDLVLDLFCEISTQICEGQILDMEFETKREVSKEEYLEMVGLKTAVLLGLSFQLGALIATDDYSKSEPLYEIGYNLGVAFQIVDDWIDAFGEEQNTGKVKGGDIYQKKKTWLWFTAMELAEEDDRAFLEQVMNSEQVSEEEVKRVLELYSLYGVSEEVMEFAEGLLEQTIRKIRETDIESSRAEVMVELANDLVKRVK